MPLPDCSCVQPGGTSIPQMLANIYCALYTIESGGGGGGGLPDQAGHAGEFLTTNGTDASWVPLAGGGDVVASGNLTLDGLILGQGGTTISASVTPATGMLTFIETPSSANLLATLTTKTGTGLNVFGTSPEFTTGVTTGSTTFGLFNTTATTINFAGAATTLNVGASAAMVLNFGGAATAAQFRFLEPSGSGTNYSAFSAQAQSANISYILPATIGTTGQVLQTTTSGTTATLSWATVSGTGDVTAASNFGTNESLIVADGTSKGVKSVPAVTVKSSGNIVTSGSLTTGAATVTSILPASNDGAALGASGTAFSDLFLASGAVINFAAGNYTLTHSSGILTVGTSMDFRMTTAGTNSASVVTVGGTQSLSAKSVSGALTLLEGGSVALDPVLSADGTYSGMTIEGTAGATLAFGDLIYLAVADSRWELVDADSVTTCGAVLTGMCVLAAASDGSATVVLLQGNIRADANFPALTVGAPVYASTTPGDIQVAQPSGTDDVIHVVGFALTADSIIFNPSQDYITHT